MLHVFIKKLSTLLSTVRVITTLRTIGHNKKEAERRLNELIPACQHSLVSPKKIFFKDFVTKWLETYAKPNIKIQPMTIIVNTINYHILPVLGHYEIAQIFS